MKVYVRSRSINMCFCRQALNIVLISEGLITGIKIRIEIPKTTGCIFWFTSRYPYNRWGGGGGLISGRLWLYERDFSKLPGTSIQGKVSALAYIKTIVVTSRPSF